MQESLDNIFVVFLHVGRIKKLRTVCVYLSLFSSLPQHIFGVIICIYLGALSWLCMLSKAYICCGIGIEKKNQYGTTYGYQIWGSRQLQQG